MKKILLVLAMVAASAFMAQPAIAADDVPGTSQDAVPPPPVVELPELPPPVVELPEVPPPPPVVDVPPPVVETSDPPPVAETSDPPPAVETPDPETPDPAAKRVTEESLDTPVICPIITTLRSSLECPPTCDQTDAPTVKRFCPPTCEQEWKSPFSKGKYCHPQCDDNPKPSSRFMGGDKCHHPKCDGDWKSSSFTFKGGDRCHHPKCENHKRGKDYSHGDDVSRGSSFTYDGKKGHGKHRSHCPRPKKCERFEGKRHDHKSWKEHSDDKPWIENSRFQFSNGDWPHSDKEHKWDKKHHSDKKHKKDCSKPKDPPDTPSDSGTESGVLPDTGGAPLWVLLMGGMLSAAGVSVLVRRSPVRGSDNGGGH